MLIYYTTNEDKENFMVVDFNKANKLGEIFKPTPFGIKDKLFYIGLSGIKGKDGKFFLKDRKDHFNNLVLGTSTHDADKILFVEDKYNPGIWNMKVIDDELEELLTVVSRGRKIDSHHTNNVMSALTEDFEDRLTYLPGGAYAPDNLRAPINRLSWQGIQSEDNADAELDDNYNSTSLGIIDGTVSSNKILSGKTTVSLGGLMLGRKNQGLPMPFKIKSMGGNSVQLFQSLSNIDLPLITNSEGHISIDHSGQGTPATFELYQGSGLSGGILGATFTRERLLLLKMKPGPRVGTTVAVGMKSVAEMEKLRVASANRRRSDMYELLGSIEVDVPGLVKQGIIPYLFKIICPASVIRGFLTEGAQFDAARLFGAKDNINIPSVGGLSILGESSIDNSANYSTNIGKTVFGTSVSTSYLKENYDTGGDLGTVVALQKSNQVYETGGSAAGDASVGDIGGEDSTKKYFKEEDKAVEAAEKGGLGEINDIGDAGPDQICVDNNIYVAQVLDHTGRYIIHGDGRTTDTTTNQPGPQIDLFLDPENLIGKSWIRFGLS